jgi:hypothetical protein
VINHQKVASNRVKNNLNFKTSKRQAPHNQQAARIPQKAKNQQRGKNRQMARNHQVLQTQLAVRLVVSLRDNNVAQKASTMFSSYSSLQYKYFHTIISILCCV